MTGPVPIAALPGSKYWSPRYRWRRQTYGWQLLPLRWQAQLAKVSETWRLEETQGVEFCRLSRHARQYRWIREMLPFRGREAKTLTDAQKDDLLMQSSFDQWLAKLFD